MPHAAMMRWEKTKKESIVTPLHNSGSSSTLLVPLGERERVPALGTIFNVVNGHL